LIRCEIVHTTLGHNTPVIYCTVVRLGRSTRQIYD
jgi:hypothetical protein